MEDGFETMVKEYCEYVGSHADNLVPLAYVTPNGKTLGKWLAHQRTKYRNGSLDTKRREMLEAVGVEWDSYETVYARKYWNEMYEAAQKYAKEYGSIAGVPHDYVTEDGHKLGQWISQQRGIRSGVRKHSVEMSEARIAMLDRLGMKWRA